MVEDLSRVLDVACFSPLLIQAVESTKSSSLLPYSACGEHFNRFALR